jgi:hypothetical protein
LNLIWISFWIQFLFEIFGVCVLFWNSSKILWSYPFIIKQYVCVLLTHWFYHLLLGFGLNIHMVGIWISPLKYSNYLKKNVLFSYLCEEFYFVFLCKN